jgi:hypothetical protein
MKTLRLIQFFFSISEKLDFWTYSLLKPDDSVTVLEDYVTSINRMDDGGARIL